MDDKVWQKALESIKGAVSSTNYKGWFLNPVRFRDIKDGRITLLVQSAFIKGQLQSRYHDLILKAVEEAAGESLLIEYVIESAAFEKKSVVEETSSEEEDDTYFQFGGPTPSAGQQNGINPKFTLDNFVVGLTNNLAFAAAQAVVQNPGISYNPLFIYGPSGVGKTHLMHAIGNAILQKNPYAKLVYATSERFMNDYIESIQNKKNSDFRAKYRNCNLLLIDDIQFISGKDSTQEEFFHTFNELSTKNSQIVLTSDRPPHEIQKLESRLSSRFQGGLMVDIQLPDFDTRIAIIKAKLQERGDILPEDCINYLAETVISNSRELEGRLVSITQMLKMSGEAPSIEFIQRIIGQQVVKKEVGIDREKVLSTINRYFNVSISDLTGPRRQKGIVLPRQIAMYILNIDCGMPLEKVGEMLGGRDHTTIMHGVDKIRTAISRDREIQRLIIEVKQAITG